MDYLECYCGQLITIINGADHLIGCSKWQKKSNLFKHAKNMLKSPDSYSLMRLECEALLQYPFEPNQAEDPDIATARLIEQMRNEEQPPVESGIQCHYCGQQWADFSKVQYLGCDSIICNTHIIDLIYEKYPISERVTCPIARCDYTLSMDEILQVVTQEELSKLEPSFESIIGKEGGIMAQCSCGNVTWLEPGKPDYHYKDDTGKILSKTHADHMAMFRFRCYCSKITCASCHAEPYHTGKTCEEFKAFKLAKHCRYCMSTIKSSANHCKNVDCKSRYKNSCKKELTCGHICFGTNDETQCSECLEEACNGRGNDYCTICHTEGLSSAPCVFLECSHIFHYECLSETLKNRWPGPRITFKFARCPACNSWINALYSPSIQALIAPVVSLYQEIRDKALKRLKYEGLENHPKLSQIDSQYYKKEEDYALNTFSYYQCFNCKNTYFGGKRDCEQNNDAAKYDPKDLVCPSCSAQGKEGADCPKHGKDYIEFKCKFCCGIAAWFCWGTTHFCDQCHTRQNNGDYLSKKNRSELPVCPGASCPLKVQHPPNGEEFALGCSFCRNLIANIKEF